VNRSLSWQVATNLQVSFSMPGRAVTYTPCAPTQLSHHVVVGSLAVGLAIALGLAPVELSVIILTCGVVLTLELINTALESVVDLAVEQTYHELAKIAKDCAAAAVLISALISLSVAVCLLLPPLWQRLQLQFF
jgi:diacylglycerol kinase (ATP)